MVEVEGVEVEEVEVGVSFEGSESVVEGAAVVAGVAESGAPPSEGA